MATRSRKRKATAEATLTEQQRKDALELLQQQIADIEGLWKSKDEDFYEERKFYQRVIDRRELIELDDRFKEYGQGIQALSPMIEDDVVTQVEILNLDEPKLDAISKEKSEKARESVEDVRIFLAQSMDRQNPGKVIGRAINFDQWTKGVACLEKGWHYPDEPDEDHYQAEMGEAYYDPADTKKTPTAEQSAARESARKKFFQNPEEHCFTLTNVNMYEMAWWPLLNPKLFIRQFEISYTEAKKLKRSKKLGDGSFHLDQYGKIVFLGESDDKDAPNTTQKSFLVVKRNHYDEEKGEWICTEWIKDSLQDWSEGEQYDEYVIPFGRPMYFIVPSGNMNPNATNPHLMYRAPVYSEVVLVYERNYINTLKLALARMQLHDNFFYLDASKLSPETRAAMEADGFQIEAAGENYNFVFRRALTNADQITALPGELKAWPFPESPNLDTRLAQIEFELERVRPNRLQIGAAIGAAKEGTATGLLDQKQASALPSEAHIDFEERFWEENARAECAAMLFWQEGKDVTKPYYYRTTGMEPVYGGSKEAGEEVYVDADKLKLDFEIRVRKRNKTQAEKMQEDLAAYQDYGQGTITFNQLLKRLDFDDPQKQEAELQREKYRLMVEAELAPVEAMMVKVYASALWGTNLAELPLPTAQGAPGSNPPAGPSPNQPAGNQLPLAGQVGPAVTPAPVPMPGGLGSANPQNGM